MKNSIKNLKKQSGIALVTGLLFLLVVTIIAVTAANNSTLALKMSASMQDSYRSFQAAEAGVYAALGLAGTAQDPFHPQNYSLDDPVVREPFESIVSNHPLRNQAAYSSDVHDVDVVLIATERDCPRPSTARGGSSVAVFDCDYYRVESEHVEDGRAKTQMELGVIKTVIGLN